ncbi:MAG: hypothetical protein ABFD46_04730 [Armatimonadota bacterium]
MSHGRNDDGGSFIWNFIAIAVIICVIAVILLPVFMRAREPSYKPSCQINLKELGVAVQLYQGDYNGMMPSSFLYGGRKTWDKSDFTHFAKERGTLPPPPGAKSSTWPMLLYQYIKNKREDALWCPSDPNRSDNPSAAVSYYWKAAIDRAWYGDDKFKARKYDDFAFPADQIILYEHNGWHWAEQNRGLVDGVTINCVFIDSHVAPKRIANSGYTASDNPPEPLPKSGVGEPAWFNHNFKSGSNAGKASKGAYWNPQMWGDKLIGY